MESVRLSKIESILNLARKLRHEPMTLSEMAESLGTGRRTAERVRDLINAQFGLKTIREKGAKTKRFFIPANTPFDYSSITADDLAVLKLSKRVLKRENMPDAASVVEKIANILTEMISGSRKTRMEADLEALLQAEGLASRPGPRPNIDRRFLETLRHAIKACRAVSFTYTDKEGKRSKREVCPYGLVYGQRHYLLAWSAKGRGLRYFALNDIKNLSITKNFFERREKFSIDEYTSKTFGVFQQKPFDVVWVFNKETAKEAGQYSFHPNERKTRLPDGTLEVKFRAGGAMEMCWHLFRWGDRVRIERPRKLKALYADFLRNAFQVVDESGVVGTVEEAHKNSWKTLENKAKCFLSRRH